MTSCSNGLPMRRITSNFFSVQPGKETNPGSYVWNIFKPIHSSVPYTTQHLSPLSKNKVKVKVLEFLKLKSIKVRETVFLNIARIKNERFFYSTAAAAAAPRKAISKSEIGNRERNSFFPILRLAVWRNRRWWRHRNVFAGPLNSAYYKTWVGYRKMLVNFNIKFLVTVQPNIFVPNNHQTYIWE